MAGCDKQRGKQASGGTTFLNGGCVFLTGREHGGGGGGGDGGDPHGDGGGRVGGDSCGPSPNGCGGGEEGRWAPCLT